MEPFFSCMCMFDLFWGSFYFLFFSFWLQVSKRPQRATLQSSHIPTEDEIGLITLDAAWARSRSYCQGFPLNYFDNLNAYRSLIDMFSHIGFFQLFVWTTVRSWRLCLPQCGMIRRDSLAWKPRPLLNPVRENLPCATKI